jgi:xanthine dehydrogenase YagS FAD-binding subunit
VTEEAPYVFKPHERPTLQRTRCVYFRNDAMPRNKRTPGSGCSAIEGENRTLAILGTSKHCIANNPSDMNVALTTLEAVIHIQGPKGQLSGCT